MMANVQALPVCSLEAEMAVLGSLLLSRSGMERVADLLSPGDFYRGSHQEIYRAMLFLYESGIAVDLVTVSSYLKDRGKLDRAGGPVYLAQLSEQVGLAANLLHYARIVYEKSVVRRVQVAAQEIHQSCLSPVDSLVQFRDMVESRMFGALDIRRAGKLQGFHEMVPDEAKRLTEAHYAAESGGMETGYVFWDYYTGGLWPAEFILLAARPSMGKTALACNLAYNVAKKGRKVAFFSLEMSKSQLTRRFMAAAGSLDAGRLKRAKLRDEEWDRLEVVARELRGLAIHINDQPATVLDIRTQARRLMMQAGLDLIVVDYLQLIKPHKGKSREQEVTAISQGLKNLAKELDIPLLAATQLNRDVEKRTDKKPILSDLRESGSLEQDGDTILFLHREGEKASVRIAKQREGATGEFLLRFAPEHQLFQTRTDEY